MKEFTKTSWVWMRLIIIVSMTIYAATGASGMDSNQLTEVSTSHGKLRGSRVNQDGVDIDAYLGIPYAQPPINELRFKRPLPLKPWSGVKNATRFSPACVQYSPSPYPWNFNKTEEQSEDCLYLNIWVPLSKTSERKAVMFWIHGGGFSLGTSIDSLYDGKALAAAGDVIVVTINYRLGPFGFFYSRSNDAPGNAAFYDMLSALKWVNNNIEVFNGDKDRITIFGESAGSLSVGYLSISNLTNNLFKRAIMQSGSPLTFPDGAEMNLDLGQLIAKHLKCSDDQTTLRTNPKKVVDCLRNISANDLAKMVGTLRPHSTVSFIGTFGDPIVGGDPIKAMKERRFHNIDLLIGCTKDEGSFMVTTERPNIFGFFGEKKISLKKSVAEEIVEIHGSTISKIDDVLKFYFGYLENGQGDIIQKQLYNAVGDILLTCPTVYFAEKNSEKNNSVYFYSYEHRPNKTPWAPLMGVVHFEELQFVFGRPILNKGEYANPEVSLSKKMMKIWTDFAKYGVPSVNWPLYSKNKPLARKLDTNDAVIYATSPYHENCDFLRSYFI